MIHRILVFCLLLVIIKTSQQNPSVAISSSTVIGEEVSSETTADPSHATPEQDTPDYAATEQPDAPDYAATEQATTGDDATPRPPVRSPCTCAGGECTCCTGTVFQIFNVTLQRRACFKVTYEPDDFSFDVKMTYNDRLIYKTTMSGKNPRPVCTPLARIIPLKMCVRLSNVYMTGRNLHACLEMEGFWNEAPLFRGSFQCFRFGQAGVAIVKPEDGGGLPPPPAQEVLSPEQLDYDDSARTDTEDSEVSEVSEDSEEREDSEESSHW